MKEVHYPTTLFSKSSGLNEVTYVVPSCQESGLGVCVHIRSGMYVGLLAHFEHHDRELCTPSLLMIHSFAQGMVAFEWAGAVVCWFCMIVRCVVVRGPDMVLLSGEWWSVDVGRV